MPQTNEFPGKVVDAIIDYLRTDWRGLAACFLASPAWAPRARLHLCQGITLELQAPAYADVHDFMRIFHPGSPLADLPISLKVHGQRAYTTLPETFTLSHLRNLRSLNIASFNVSSVAQFQKLLKSCSRLEELYVYRLMNLSHDSPNQQSLSPDSRLFPRLKTLRFQFYGVDWGFYSLCSALRDGLSRADPPAPPLSVFSMHLVMHHPLSQWAPVIGRLQVTLSDIRITIKGPLNSAEDKAFFTTVARCRGLHRLTFFLVPFRDTHNTATASFIASLADWMSSPSCLFASSFRQLVLVFVCSPLELHDHSSAALKKLAQALRPETYPALVNVSISVREKKPKWLGSSRSKNGDSDNQISSAEACERLGAFLQPLRDRGVRVDVVTGRPSFKDCGDTFV